MWPGAVACLALVACSGTGRPIANQHTGSPPAYKIITTERGPRGGRLVALDERGVRLADVTKSGAECAMDLNPAWSPDGRYVIFASTRGHRLDSKAAPPTQLWVVEVGAGSPPRRLTSGAASYGDPRFLPSGDGIVFVSDREGSLDLYRVALSRGAGVLKLRGQPQRITRAAGAERSPTISPDGKRIAYMSIEGQASIIRELDLRTLESRALTSGPFDVTPRFAPEGNVLAYARRDPDRNLMELVLYDLDRGEHTDLPELGLADLTGPIFTADGRHLLATAVYRSADTGAALLSSVVVADLMAPEPVWRALHDPAFVESRLGAAVSSRVLKPSQIDRNLPYPLALKQAIERHIIERIEQHRRGDGLEGHGGCKDS